MGGYEKTRDGDGAGYESEGLKADGLVVKPGEGYESLGQQGVCTGCRNRQEATQALKPECLKVSIIRESFIRAQVSPQTSIQCWGTNLLYSQQPIAQGGSTGFAHWKTNKSSPQHLQTPAKYPAKPLPACPPCGAMIRLH